MSLLQGTSSGIQEVPQINTIYGDSGLGKTTFASKFEAALFFDIEGGSRRVVTTRLLADKLPDYASVLKGVDELLTGKHEFKTLNIDSLSVLERYIHRHLCGVKYANIEAYDGGFGKGYTAAKDEAANFMKKVAQLRDTRGMTINLIAHSMVKAHTDPYDQVTYDRHILQCNEKFAQVIKQLSDNVLFVKKPITHHTDAKTKKIFASTDGETLLITEWRPAADAKNRLNLPAELPLNYDKFVEAIKLGIPKSAGELMGDIRELVKRVDAETAKRAMEKAETVKAHADDLLRIKTKLAEIVSTQQGA